MRVEENELHIMRAKAQKKELGYLCHKKVFLFAYKPSFGQDVGVHVDL